MSNVTAQLFQPQKQLFITGEVFSEAGRSHRKGFSIQQTECACPCCVLYTLSSAAKKPLAASLLATLALGHRRCLTVSRSFAGLRTILKFNAREILGIPLLWYFTTVNSSASHCALVDTECHGSPSVAKHASISNSETSPARGSAGSLRTFKNKSTVDTAAALLEGNFTRLRRHRADTYKY